MKKPGSKKLNISKKLGGSAFILLILQSAIFFATWSLFYNPKLEHSYLYKGNILLVLIYFFISLLIYLQLDSYNITMRRESNLFIAHGVSGIIVTAFVFIELLIVCRGFLNVLPLIGMFVVNLVVSVVWVLLSKMYIKSVYHPYKTAVLYSNSYPELLVKKIETRPDQFDIQGMIELKDNFEEVKEEMKKYEAILIAFIDNEERHELIKFCFENDITLFISTKISDVLIRGATEYHAFDMPLLICHNNGFPTVQRIIKRAFDILFSLLALIILSPVFLIVSLCIKLEDGGPVFFRQERSSLYGKKIKIFKFRSMIPDAEKKSGAVLAAKNDNRITKIGKIIRATRIDELPQFINVLTGDMSIVGPRPERQVFIDEYCEYVPEFKYRLKVKAGLTGYAQIMGKYNTNPYNKLLLDLMYVQKFSLWLDFRLILLTIKIMFIKDSTDGVDEEFNAFLQTFGKANIKDNPIEINEEVYAAEDKI